MESERLRYLPWRIEDAPAALEIYGDPLVTRYIGGQTAADLDAMCEQLRGRLERTSRFPAGQGAWAAWRGDQLVGCALMKPLPGSDGAPTEHIEVGWHLGRRWWGQGLATEMGRRLLHLGFETLGLPRLHAVVEPPNEASQRVAERLGMTLQGPTTAFYSGLTLQHYILDAPGPANVTD